MRSTQFQGRRLMRTTIVMTAILVMAAVGGCRPPNAQDRAELVDSKRHVENVACSSNHWSAMIAANRAHGTNADSIGNWVPQTSQTGPQDALDGFVLSVCNNDRSCLNTEMVVAITLEPQLASAYG